MIELTFPHFVENFRMKSAVSSVGLYLKPERMDFKSVILEFLSPNSDDYCNT